MSAIPPSGAQSGSEWEIAERAQLIHETIFKNHDVPLFGGRDTAVDFIAKGHKVEPERSNGRRVVAGREPAGAADATSPPPSLACAILKASECSRHS